MPASIHNVPFKDDDFKERVSYADLEEGDHIATLLDIEDAEASTGNYGWKFVFDVKGLPLNTTVWLRGGMEGPGSVQRSRYAHQPRH